jgi:hypothetical protein
MARRKKHTIVDAVLDPCAAASAWLVATAASFGDDPFELVLFDEVPRLFE